MSQPATANEARDSRQTEGVVAIGSGAVLGRRLTSEEIHEITAQPPPGCPLIDAVIAAAEKSAKKIRGWEKLKDESDIGELHDMLWDVEQTLDFFQGRHNDMDKIRERLEEVRAWGEEWKQYALKLHNGESA